MKRIVSGIIFLFILTLSMAVSAQEKAVEYYVDPVLGKNQVPTQTAYPHLKVSPNSNYEIQFKIRNREDKPITLYSEAVNTLTSIKGQYYFTPSDGTKESRIDKDYRVRPLIVDGKKMIQLKAKETKIVTFKVQTPSEPIKGLMVGGIVFSPDQLLSSKEDGNVTINYQLKKILPVKLQFDQEVFKKPSIDSLHYADGKVIAKIDNENPAILREGKGRLQLHSKDGVKVFDKELGLFEMAPMTGINFEMPLTGAIDEGKYIAEVELKFKEGTVRYSDEITIAGNTATKTSSADPFSINEKANWWPLLAIPVLFFLLWKWRNKWKYYQADEELQNLSTKERRVHNFLSERRDRKTFILHRELHADEYSNFKADEVIEYKKKKFEKSIRVFDKRDKLEAYVDEQWEQFELKLEEESNEL